MRKLYYSITVLAVFVTAVPATAFADHIALTTHGPSPVPAAATKAAERATHQALPQLVLSNNIHARELGFTNSAEVGIDGSDLILPNPFAVYMVSLSALRSFQPTIDARNLLGRVTRYLFPIKTKDATTAKSSVLVALTPPRTQWHIVRIGSSNLIKRLTKYGSGESSFVVWIPSLGRYYLGTFSSNQFMILAVADDAIGVTTPLALNEGNSTPAQQVFLKLSEEANVPQDGAR